MLCTQAKRFGAVQLSEMLKMFHVTHYFENYLFNQGHDDCISYFFIQVSIFVLISDTQGTIIT